MKFLTIIFLLFSLHAFSQKSNLKFGKVSEEELTLQECAFYPEANSMVLGEFGTLNFMYNSDKGWSYNLVVHRRIKVFSKLDKDIANIKLRVYDPLKGNSKEEIGSIKAFTYNLIDGKIEKTKLTNAEEYTTRINDYRMETSFAMPDVREGSVFEYQYSLSSDLISTLSTWHFQDDLPVEISEFRYTIPEFFKYTVSQVGSFVNLEREEMNINESFTYRWESVGAGGNVERGTGTLPSVSVHTTQTGRNLLPLQDEPFMNNKPNVPARLEFQLMSINMPNRPIKTVAGNYEDFNKNIMDWTSFGKTLNNGNFAKDKISTLSEDTTTRATEIYNWLSNHFSHNDVFGFTSERVGRSAFNDGQGSLADINLTLVAAYREAGLEAYPVILSTRGHGIPHPIYPNYEDYNYVVAAVKTSAGIVLTDGTSKLPFGILPTRCLNNKGWMATENGGTWIDLKSEASHAVTVISQFDFMEDKLNSQYSVKMDGYAETEAHSNVKSGGQQHYTESIASHFSEWEVDSLKIDTETGFNLNFEIAKEIEEDETVYLQPISYGMVIENPFKREERLTPVDFPYQISKRVIVKISVPEGFIAELPESTIVTLPNNGGKFIYSINQIGSNIQIMSMFKLNQLDFSPDEYPFLKQFYQLVAEKNNEIIVLKKS
ncbi:hypothetical protein [Marinoscillum sp.]|uniref:transglutaminase domain-containing protein n=1 Tax=Marinoscillum sp. TaxID=2024838 RepID=UPI003BADB816